ncbi:MAG: hypothetical protein OZ948_09590 [Deltaproteobacteria bacterium]|nr:hypothetical protein [Deltaproteobacteria bacterium]
MRKSSAAFLVALAAVLPVLGAGPASAGQLDTAEFSFQIGTLPPASFTGSGTTGTATSNTLATIDAGSTITGSFTTPVTDPAAVPVTGIQAILSKNGSGSFAGAGTLAGSATFEGVANVLAFGGVTLLGVPLNVGSGETVIATGAGGVISITAISGTWTTDQASVAGVPFVATVTRTGTNNLSASGAGTITLVAPVTIMTNLPEGNYAAFAELALSYAAPEPTTALAFAGAIATVCALAYRRRRT